MFYTISNITEKVNTGILRLILEHVLSTDGEGVCSFCLEILSFAVGFRRVDLRSFSKLIFLTSIRQKAKRGPHHYPSTSLLSIEFPKFLFKMKTSLKLENLLQIYLSPLRQLNK
jgi:hypothetical protein